MIEKKLVDLCKRYGIIFLGIFGSYATGSFTPQSDLDLMVRFEDRKSLLEIVRIEREISESIGLKVDLLTEKSINPYIKDRINKEMKVIYDGKG
ncbi:nucleotidyltransferase family protein [Candidatus Margulisiibacteriota bacterium]